MMVKMGAYHIVELTSSGLRVCYGGHGSLTEDLSIKNSWFPGGYIRLMVLNEVLEL